MWTAWISIRVRVRVRVDFILQNLASPAKNLIGGVSTSILTHGKAIMAVSPRLRTQAIITSNFTVAPAAHRPCDAQSDFESNRVNRSPLRHFSP